MDVDVVTTTRVRDVWPLFCTRLDGMTSVLDVGCGPGERLAQYPVAIRVGIDVHRPYLERFPRQAGLFPVCLDARELGRVFLPRTFDAVVFFDSLEHFTREEGLAVLEAAEAIAAKRVIVFTPRGFFPQEAWDYYAAGGEAYQTHRSGWEVQDFLARGYRVTVLEGYHDARNLAFLRAFGPDHDPVDALLASRDVTDQGG